MAKTALLQWLRRAYAIAQISAQSNIPLDEVPDILNEQLSRRRVLRGGLAIAGTVAFTPPFKGRLAGGGDRSTYVKQPLTSSASLSPESKVLIVGAGVAGLTAAFRLRQSGVPVDIVEANQRVGGRLRSLTNLPKCPGTVELGGEFIDSRHSHVLSLAQELGLEVADLKAADSGLAPEIFYFQGRKINHDSIIEAFSPLAEQIAQDLKTISRQSITYQSPSPDAIRLDHLSLAEYLSSASIDPVIEQLVRVAYVTEFGRDAEDQSCLNMLFLIGSEVGQWSTYGVSDERYHIVGGNDQLSHRLAAALEGFIETRTVLESIRMNSDGRYRVSLRQGATSLERKYERILLTVPFSVLRQVELAVDLPPVKQRAIAELGYGSSTKLVTPYREKIWRTRHHSTSSIYTELEFQNTWESARYLPGLQGWLTNLRGGRPGITLGSGSPDAHAQALADDLEPIFPGISQVQRGQAIRAFWAGEPYSQGSYSCYLPGQWTQIGGAESERTGNLWFAGEHCALESQGYINGACETAEAAAASILDDLGLQPGLAQQTIRWTES